MTPEQDSHYSKCYIMSTVTPVELAFKEVDGIAFIREAVSAATSVKKLPKEMSYRAEGQDRNTNDREDRSMTFGTNNATRGLLAMDHVILNYGQVTWTTPELAPPSPN
ncbi:hypothetical protein TNCV_2866041 [Trichonephila clavipes]|nr:hypothetical protein TNCV_2866041 [Trichonephila clavipes]